MECKFTKAENELDRLYGINRYIMECKFQQPTASASPSFELIDTLWNVNNLWIWLKLQISTELIDTLWNVNCTASGMTWIHICELIDTLWNVNNVPSA